MAASLLELINSTNYAIIDIEGIQLEKNRDLWKGRFSRHHHCLRKIAILCRNGDYGCEESYPCIKFWEMTDKERRGFNYNRRYVHHLQYYPKNRRDLTCMEMLHNVGNFLELKDINMILHKGGNLERDIANKFGLDHLNLELIDIPVAPTHNPLEEVQFYRNCLDNKMDSIGLISRYSLL